MRDHRRTNSRAAAIANTPGENSVNQARWLLMPLFGLWIMLSVAGLIFG